MQCLPIIATCDQCAACCMTQCSPPGYLLLLCQPQKSHEWPDQEDVQRVEYLPHEARLAIDRYRRDLVRRQRDRILKRTLDSA